MSTKIERQGFNQEYLKEAMTYDSQTGEFFWKRDRPQKHFGSNTRSLRTFRNNIRSNNVAGSTPSPTARNPKPYRIIGLAGVTYKAHRLAWLYHYGEWPDGDIDHIDQDTLNNKISNLRISEEKVNHRNRGMYKNNTSGCNGISFYAPTSKWRPEGQIIQDGKRVRFYLGNHDTLLEAACARKSWEVKYGYADTHGSK